MATKGVGKDPAYRALAQQLDALEDQIAAAEASGGDTSALEAQEDQIHQQMSDMRKAAKSTRDQERTDRKAARTTKKTSTP